MTMKKIANALTRIDCGHMADHEINFYCFIFHDTYESIFLSMIPHSKE